MKKQKIIVLLLFFIISACKPEPILSNGINENGLPIKDETILNIEPTLINVTVIPTQTIPKNRNEGIIPQAKVIRYVLQTFYQDDASVLLLGQNLDLINKFSDSFTAVYAYGNAFIDPSTCQIIDVIENNEKNSDGKLHFNGVDVRYYSINGNLKFSKTINFSIEPQYSTYQYRISPNGKWIGFKFDNDWQGNRSIHSGTTQDVLIIPVKENETVESIILTTNHGAWPAEINWSPDGNFLAFTDFDEFGAQQIYLYDPENDRVSQLTNLKNKNSRTLIYNFKWSDNSKYIAFLSEESDQDDFELKTISRVLGLVDKDTGDFFRVIDVKTDQEIFFIGFDMDRLVFKLDKQILSLDTNTRKTAVLADIMNISNNFNPISLVENGKEILFIDGVASSLKRYDIQNGEIYDTELVYEFTSIHFLKSLHGEIFLNCPKPD